MTSPKSSKKVTGFKVYRDDKGRFISKAVYDALPKRKKKSNSVAVKRDEKGRFLSEKWLEPSVAVIKEKIKRKPKKAKAKKVKVAKPKCNYSKVFEIGIPKVSGHYNVVGVKNLSVECLAALLQNQINRKAEVFRLWYKVPSSPAYPGGIASTNVFNRSVFFIAKGGKKRKGGIQGFLKLLQGPVLQYWYRTEGYSRHEINLHGIPHKEYRK